MSEAIIRLEDIQKSYFMGSQAIPVLKGISLDILKQNTRTDTGTYNVTAGASIRNLKTNLGN